MPFRTTRREKTILAILALLILLGLIGMKGGEASPFLPSLRGSAASLECPRAYQHDMSIASYGLWGAAAWLMAGEDEHANERSTADAELMRRIAGGDRTALGDLYDRFSRPLFSTALHVLNDASEAQDIVHDAFLSLWERASSFEPERGSAFAWAVTLTRNRAIDRLRARRRRAGLIEKSAPSDLGYEEKPSDAGADAHAVAGDRAQVVRSAVAGLPAEQKRALELAFFGGLTQQEIAERLQEPLGTIKARIRRGLLRLRDSLPHRL